MNQSNNQKRSRAGRKLWYLSAAALTLILVPALYFMLKVEVRAQSTLDGERMALYAKPAVVHIFASCSATMTLPGVGSLKARTGGWGSGFFISSDGYILTNAHVVDAVQANAQGVKMALFPDFIRAFAKATGKDPNEIFNNEAFVNQLFQQLQVSNISKEAKVILGNGSEYTYKVAAFGNPINEKSSKDVAVIKIDIRNAPILLLGDSDKVQDQEHVSVVGYPGAQESPVLDEKSNVESSITDGKISARRKAKDGLPILQTTAPATHGNSGGPVLNDAGEVIGQLTFGGRPVNGQEIAGFAFIVPTSTALEFVSKANARNEESEVDKVYRQGLDAYFQKNYAAAAKHFESVKKLFPQHSKANWLIDDCRKHFTPGLGISLSLPIVVSVGGVLFLLVMVGVALVFVRSSGFSIKKAFFPAVSQSVAPRPILRGITGSYAGKTMPLDGKPLMLGRDPRYCQLVFPREAADISQRHCGLRYDAVGQVFVLEDYQSTNGTFLQSGERLQSGTARLLKPGERFSVGGADNLFEVAYAPVPNRAAQTAPAPQIGFVPFLRGLQGEYAGSKINLGSQPLVIGRDPQMCQLVFPSRLDDISKRHCLLRYDAVSHAFVLEDLGSTNGTYVVSANRREQVSPGQTRRLSPRDQFYLGDPGILFEVGLEQRS